MNGWLTDALQGRITCASPENVESLTEWFQDVLSTQARTADDNERNTLSANPTGAEIINYDLSGLVDEDTERPIDGLATFCEGVMTPEGKCSLQLLSTIPALKTGSLFSKLSNLAGVFYGAVSTGSKVSVVQHFVLLW